MASRDSRTARPVLTIIPLCDAAKKPELESFFKPRIDKLEDRPRVYQQLELRVAQNKAHTPAIAAFLKNQ
jgi:hypothetical protein